MVEASDRVRGILLGLCAGDRNGGPIRMALELAESLHSLDRFNAEDVLRRYVGWFRQEGTDTGPVAARVFERVADGEPPLEAAQLVDQEFRGLTAGCNPAHRVPPLAMPWHIGDDDLPALARQEARLTHWHPLAADVSAATVVLCRALVRGKDWESCIELASTNRDPMTRAALKAKPDLPLSSGGFAPEALRAAVFFVGSSSDFGGALSKALEFAGPANYCPVLVGAIAGARWGASQIPQARLTEGAVLRRALDLSEALSASW